jgi:hypothetical protein
MRWRRGPDGAVYFSSTGLLADGWRPLAPESVTVVELATLDVTVHELATAQARPDGASYEPAWLESGGA